MDGMTSSMSGRGIMGSLYVLLLGAYFFKDRLRELYNIFLDAPLFIRRAAEAFLICWVFVIWIVKITNRWRKRECYLVDYSCYRPPDDRKMNAETSVYFSIKYQPHVAEHLDFQWRIYLRSGLGDETHGARFLYDNEGVATLEEARAEMEESFAAVLDDLFAKTHVAPQDIDILIVTVSSFTPAPSHSAWIVNRYKMKESVKTFNLSGMGCSASLIGIKMAKDLLRIYGDSYALLVGTENTTVNANYQGNDKSMMLTNCLFRVGGNAVLLSNKPEEASRAKMRLLHVVRTLTAEDDSHNCVMAKEDADGFYGIALRHSLIEVATRAVKNNLTELGPKVLPLMEQLYFAYNAVCIHLFKMKVEPYIPNFRLVFRHFCIHPGGRAVVNGIGKSLRLGEDDLEPSRMALHRFGNTSISGIWYAVSYMEAKRQFKAGDRLLQIALGSGFKCNTAVWQVMRETHPLEPNVWSDCIDRYPCSTRHRFGDDYPRKYLDTFKIQSQ